MTASASASALNQPLVQLKQVVRNYITPAGMFPALRGVDLNIGTGEFVAIVGKSGSGKSTLINCLTAIDKPTSGEVWIAGTAVHKLTENQSAIWRGNNVGIVFQFFQLLPTLSVVDNLVLPMDFCNRFKPEEREARAMQLLTTVGLEDHARKLPTELSGGQQQRAAIARALANDPPILCADEPTGNLDSKTADAIFALFSDMASRGKTIIMVTHDRDLASRVGRAVLVADGLIVEDLPAKARSAS